VGGVLQPRQCDEPGRSVANGGNALHQFGGVEVIVQEEVPRPAPGEGAGVGPSQGRRSGSMGFMSEGWSECPSSAFASRSRLRSGWGRRGCGPAVSGLHLAMTSSASRIHGSRVPTAAAVMQGDLQITSGPRPVNLRVHLRVHRVLRRARGASFPVAGQFSARRRWSRGRPPSSRSSETLRFPMRVGAQGDSTNSNTPSRDGRSSDNANRMRPRR
jgi:hypothetical protein